MIFTTPINGQMIQGKLNEENIKDFCEWYRCTIEPTNKRAYIRNINTIQVGATDQVQISEEPVYAIYITQGMLDNLMKTVLDTVNEENRRKNDKKLMELYIAYKMMDNILK